MATKQEAKDALKAGIDKFKEYASTDGTTSDDVIEVYKYLQSYNTSTMVGENIPPDKTLVYQRNPVATSGQQRWIANQFFEGGRTKNPRLDEIWNQANNNVTGIFDTTDEQLIELICNRAGVRNDASRKLIKAQLMIGLGLVDDPYSIMNPNKKPPANQSNQAVRGQNQSEAQVTPKVKPEDKRKAQK